MTIRRHERLCDILLGATCGAAALWFIALIWGFSVPVSAHNDTTIVGCAHDREIIERLDLILARMPK